MVNGHPAKAEEQCNRKNVRGYDPTTGNGRCRRAAGVKTGKLCAEQDQIGTEPSPRRYEVRVDCLSPSVTVGLEK